MTNRPIIQSNEPEIGDHEDEQDAIAIRWHIDDVLEVRPDLTAAQARNVLQRVRDCHDASVGISWETLEIAADAMLPTGD